ncbi:MAG TPA: hypothetical protein VFA07_19385 [Chthonomonadaceae bacterium]|nr:hypothetical protein [Chthonomonadaceae bacterium]
MNWAHLHLLMNHIPVLGTLFGLLLLIAGVIARSISLKTAALVVFIVAALAAIPVYLSGEPASEMIEKVPGVVGASINQHEAAAKVALAGVEILGLMALGGLILSQRTRSLSKAVVSTVLVVGIGVTGPMAWTANLGGQIHHPEIRGAAAQASGGETTLPGASPERQDDD